MANGTKWNARYEVYSFFFKAFIAFTMEVKAATKAEAEAAVKSHNYLAENITVEVVR